MSDVARWVGEMPEAYERGLVPTLFRPFARDLAGRVAAKGPATVLELAAGTGAVTRELVALLPDASITATDLNEAMLEAGRARAPEATWRQADALDLPFDDATFDVVTCQFGVMFFPDRARAFTEIRRVLRPGGSVLLYTWGSVEESDFAAAVDAALARTLAEPLSFMREIPHGYHDHDQIAADVRAGGLDLVDIERVTLTGTAADAHTLAAGFTEGTPMRLAFPEAGLDLTDATQALAAVMAERLGDPPTGEMTAHLIEATPPT